MKLMEVGNTDVVKLALDKAGFECESFFLGGWSNTIKSNRPGVAACLVAKDRVDMAAKQILADNDSYPSKDYTLIGVYHTVFCDDEIWQTPVYEDGLFHQTLARRYLERYSKKDPQLHTAVYAYNLATGIKSGNYSIARPRFEKFTEQELVSITSDPFTYQFAGALPFGDPTNGSCRIVESREIRPGGKGSQLVAVPEQLLTSILAQTEEKQMMLSVAV
jgi:hypothetical protein